jgi:hypothetical protein
MDHIGITQQIVNRAVQAAETCWTGLLINYHVDDEQSEYGYDAIDWDARFLDNGWNFPAVTSLH